MIQIDHEKKAEEIVSEARARNGFGGNIKVKPIHQKPCFSGVIKELRDIDISYNPAYPLHPVTLRNPFSSALEAVIEHEITHKEDGLGRGCPKNNQLDIDKVLAPISKVLKKKGLPNVPFGTQGHTLYTYFANLFEDIVDNTIVCDNRGAEGIFLVYEDMARHTGSFGDLFEGFLKLQAMTFPHVHGVSSLIPHFRQSEKAKKAVKNYLSRTGLQKIQRNQRVDALARPENWKRFSTIFAEEFSQLVDPKDLSASYFPVFGGNDFARLDDDGVLMELALKAYGKKGDSFEPPDFMDNNQALLFLYKQWAREMEIKVNSYSVETERPVAYVSKRQFDFEKDQLERLEFGLNAKGKFQPQTGKYALKVISRYQVSAGTFPEVRVGLLDCSGSTQLSIGEKRGKVMNPWAEENKQWTDNSIYHHELLCFFGLCELFRRRGTLKSSNVRLGVFSDKTRMGKDLGESERLALQPSFGGTKLSKKYLEEIFQGRNSLVYSISDGEIKNWANVKDEFIEGAKRHNYFHLQIGGESQMYKDLKAEGLRTILDDGKNSAKVLVDLTQREIYGGK